MSDENVTISGFCSKTVAIAMMLLFVLPNITALETDPTTQGATDRGGKTLVVFENASREDFEDVVQFIKDEGGSAYAINPPNIMRADLRPGTQREIETMPGVHSVHRGIVDASGIEGLNKDTVIGIKAWNINVKEGPMTPFTVSGHGHDHSKGLHSSDPMALIHDDTIVCYEDQTCTNDLIAAKERLGDLRLANKPLIMGENGVMAPAPGPSDTTEFMMGSIGVSIIFPESNGSIDTSTEDWTSGEETNVINQINNAFTWWTNRINAQGLSVSTSWSYTAYYKQPTSYEPISRASYTGAAANNMWTWMNEIQGDLGFGNGIVGARAFSNYTRAQLGTDWGYITWIADSSADADNFFSDNKFGFALLGGPYVVMTYGNDGYGIGGMGAVMSHETGHIFYALDEYSGAGDSDDRSGYLNVINGNAEDSGTVPPQSNVGCIMRGGTSAFNNNQVCSFTRGMIGWNDTDSDNIPDILDTFPNSTIDPITASALNTTTYTYYGNTTVVPLTNLNPWGFNNDITLNIVDLVQWRIDNGSWSSAIPMDGAWSNETEAWNFTLNGLTEGWHTVDVRSRNDQNNWETTFGTDTFLVDLAPPSSQVGALPQYVNTPSFEVNWTGSDGAGSGLVGVKLFYRFNGGPYTQYLSQFAGSPISFIHQGDGLYEFYTIATDNASNWEAPPLTPDAFTTVEATPPNSTIEALPPYINTTAFDIDYTALDEGVGVASVELFSRKDKGPWTSLGDPGGSPYNFVSSGDGIYDFYAIATDGLGNVEKKAQMPEGTTIVDMTLPETSTNLVGVMGDNGWYTSGVIVTMSTNEPVGHLDHIMYMTNNGSWDRYNGSFTLTGDGSYHVRYYAVDKAANYEAPKDLYLKLDTTGPEGAIMINGGNLSTTDPTVEVGISASDDTSRVNGMMVSEDSSFTGMSWMNLTDRISYDLSSNAGIKTLYAMFRNSAGIESEPVTATIILDSSGPIIKITNPKDVAIIPTYGFIVEGTARDNVDIDLVQISLDGENWTLCNGTTEWDSIITVPIDGPYTIHARTFDLVGNIAQASINITIDAGLPELEMDTPRDNSVSEKKSIPVEGVTDPSALVSVNGASVPVTENGTFSTLVSLKDGTNILTVSITKPAGTITKRIRVIYVHPPIIISDLKHFPPNPTREDNVTITCIVPGDHIKSVELKWKLFGKAEETVEMVRGEDDLYTAKIGPFDMGGYVEYYVLAKDDTGEKARFPEKEKKNFNVPMLNLDPGPKPEPKGSDNGFYGIIFMIILFAIVASMIGLSMRTPKHPPGVGPRRISERTMSERVDDDRSRPRPRDKRIRESDRYRAGRGETRFRDEDI